MKFDLIEDAYSLSPLQEGLLFHTLFTPDDAVYVEQSLYPLPSGFDPDAFERVWQKVVGRHAALRTSFHWEDLDEPIQVVQSSVKVKIDRHDWSTHPKDRLQERMDEFLLADRRQSFDLTSAPVVRLAIIRAEPEAWYLCVTFHHILLDHSSASLILDEVFSYYAADLAGTSLTLPPAPGFGAYVAWIQKQDPASAERFWRGALEGFATPTALPVGKSHADQRKSKNARTQQLWLSEEESAALRDFARNHQLTISTIVQGGWALLLSRYNGQKNVLFGAVVSGRPPSLRDSDKMVGLFINTLPIPARVNSNLLAATWLKRLQELLVDVREHDYSSLAQIQSWSAVPGGVPLFESIVNVYNTPQPTAKETSSNKEAPKESKLRSTNAVSGDHYPITLLVAPGRQIGMNITYDENRFDAETVKRVLGHLRQLFIGIATNPDAKIAALPLLTEPERCQLLVDWNDTGTDYPRGRCLHTFFEEQTERTPNATAVVFQDQSLTYSELNGRANQLAHHLTKQGVGPETLVGVCVERSLAMLVGMLGILKAAGAYVPMDPAYPSERLAYMVSESQAPVILTQSSLVDHLSGTSAQRVLLDEADVFSKESSSNPSTTISASNLAYVIYTSGSTGRPKGVALTHGSAGALLCWAQGVYSQEELSGVLGSTSICFDLSVFELFLPLSVGGSVILAQNALELPSLPARDKVTLINTVPSAISELHRLGGIPGSVQTINLAGEPLTSELVDRLYSSGVGKVYDLYGPSEDTTYSTWSLRRAGGPATIGRPISNTQAYLLDDRMCPVPLGVSGELYLGGEGLARGYFGRSASTAEKFVPDPFSGKGGGRLYRTGDLARYYGNGDIEFLGRIDHQVKVRGFRIELGEIESVLKSYAGVKECVVVAREDTPGDKRLVAYVVGKGVHADRLREYLVVKLPTYMVPAHFVFLESLPLSPNGKIDRKALPHPDPGQGPNAGAIAPRSPIEAAIAQIWSDVLRIPSIGITDNFFDLGGHSLLATQVISRIRSTFQVELPLRAIFDAPTVELLAHSVLDTRRNGAIRAIPPLERAKRGMRAPLSFAQQRLWFIDQLHPGLAAYNMPLHLRLRGPLDRSALGRALEEVIKRHEVLRTNFVAESSEAMQVISDDAGMSLPYLDLTGVPEEQWESEAQRLCIEQLDMPFDLTKDRLVRATLIGFADDDHVLAIAMHHIVCDGWSVEILLRELTTLYEAFQQEKPSLLLDLPIQYADYAIWQREWLQGEELERQVSYWRSRLAGAPPVLDLPTDRPREAAKSFQGGSEAMALPAQASQELKTLCSEERASLFMALLAIFNILLHCYTRQEDIVVGTDEAGRSSRATEALIGFFVNHLVLRTDLSDNPSFRDLLRRVRETTLDAYTHSDLPFDKLVGLIQSDREASHTPLFQVLFVMQPPVSASSMQTSLKISGVGNRATSSKYDIVLFVRESSSTVSTSWVYRTELFDPSTIRAMASDFEAIARCVASSPDTSLSDVKALLLDLAAKRSAEEREARRLASRPRLRPGS